MKLKVLQPWKDLKEKVIRKANEEFEVSDERGAEILINLPKGYVELVIEDSKQKSEQKKVTKTEEK